MWNDATSCCKTCTRSYPLQSSLELSVHIRRVFVADPCCQSSLHERQPIYAHIFDVWLVERQCLWHAYICARDSQFIQCSTRANSIEILGISTTKVRLVCEPHCYLNWHINQVLFHFICYLNWHINQVLFHFFQAMKSKINKNTCMLVGSAPCFNAGVIDYIEAVAKVRTHHIYKLGQKSLECVWGTDISLKWGNF